MEGVSEYVLVSIMLLYLINTVVLWRALFVFFLGKILLLDQLLLLFLKQLRVTWLRLFLLLAAEKHAKHLLEDKQYAEQYRQIPDHQHHFETRSRDGPVHLGVLICSQVLPLQLRYLDLLLFDGDFVLSWREDSN